LKLTWYGCTTQETGIGAGAAGAWFPAWTGAAFGSAMILPRFISGK